MAQALIAAAGAGIDGALKLNEQLMKRKGNKSSRSCGIIFKNLSNQRLYITGSGLSHGVWTGDAHIPLKIDAGKAVAWMNESQGVMTGCQGWANLSLDQQTEWDININWNVPYVGSNSYDSKLNNKPDYKIFHSGPQGDNATFMVTFSAVDPDNNAPEEDDEEEERNGGDSDNGRGSGGEEEDE